MRYTTAYLMAIALLFCVLVLGPYAVSADTVVLVKGINLTRGVFDPQILLPNAKILDIAGTVQALQGIRFLRQDILFRDVTSGERLNLSTVTWVSLSDLLTDPARYGVLIYDPELKELKGYEEYTAPLEGTPTLSSVLEKAGTIGVIPDDTFLRPTAFSFPTGTLDEVPPIVTPPFAISIPATEAGGARPSASAPLTAFLAGGSATDNVDPSPIRLSPQIGQVDVYSGTLFPIGVTTVTFRFRDHSNNVGSATSTVTVAIGLPRLSGSISGKGEAAPGIMYVDLKLTNTGTGNARNVTITSLPLRTLSGTGTMTLNSPALPIVVGDLNVGASATIHFLLSRPLTVTRFSITESGTVLDVTGKLYSYSIGQAVIP